MGETFSWPEGAIYAWTGSATSSALLLYAEEIQGAFQRGWENYQTLDGVYHDRHTGQRVDVRVGTLYCRDNSALRAFFDTTAVTVHLHLKHSNSLSESAGYFLYTGVIDALTLDGRKDDLFRYAMSYHSNVWSAY